MQSKDAIGGLTKVDSRRSGNRVLSGGTGELPAMTTLSGNTNSSFRENGQGQHQYALSSGAAAQRMQHTKNANSYSLSNSVQGRN